MAVYRFICIGGRGIAGTSNQKKYDRGIYKLYTAKCMSLGPYFPVNYKNDDMIKYCCTRVLSVSDNVLNILSTIQALQTVDPAIDFF